MKKLSIKNVKEMMKKDPFIFVRINTITNEVRVVDYNYDDLDDVLGYLTFNQYLKFTSEMNTKKNNVYSGYTFSYYRYIEE